MPDNDVYLQLVDTVLADIRACANRIANGQDALDYAVRNCPPEDQGEVARVLRDYRSDLEAINGRIDEIVWTAEANADA